MAQSVNQVRKVCLQSLQTEVQVYKGLFKRYRFSGGFTREMVHRHRIPGASLPALGPEHNEHRHLVLHACCPPVDWTGQTVKRWGVGCRRPTPEPDAGALDRRRTPASEAGAGRRQNREMSCCHQAGRA